MVSATSAPPVFVVILAGGIGSRFWPASTPERPKQLLPISGHDPLIVETVRRAERIAGADRVRLLIGPELLDPFRSVLPDYPTDRFWVEPRARSTGPALAWAASRIERLSPGSVMVSLHADHLIEPPEEFVRTIRLAIGAAARRPGLVCLGAEPTRPETGYGYVELAEEVEPGVRSVRRFVEKPDPETARSYLATENHLWNTGIFVWRASTFLDAARRWCVEIADGLPALDADDAEGFYSKVTPVSVDVGVLERADSVECIRASFAWDDVGTWEALTRIARPDAAGNFVRGACAAVESSDNVVWGETARVLLFGVHGLVVVQSGDRILVTRRDRASELKRALAGFEEGEDAT